MTDWFLGDAFSLLVFNCWTVIEWINIDDDLRRLILTSSESDEKLDDFCLTSLGILENLNPGRGVLFTALSSKLF